MSENKSKISDVAAARISTSPLGIPLLQAFQRLEQEMNQMGASDMFTQLGFLQPGDPVEPGQLIPTLHFSLRPYEPLMSQPMELVYQPDEESDGE